MSSNNADHSRTVVIHQALHGYERGHRELAASVGLDDRSRATMLVMSDLLAASALDEGSSYLAAYPLRASSKHVIARTWGAGPNYRPGSVWTHSLVLDYQALALIPDLAALTELLVKPASRGLAGYSEALEFALDRVREVKTDPPVRALYAIASIYSPSPAKELILHKASDGQDEALALALWRQMWPALRRDFAFLTCVADRPVNLDAGCFLRFGDKHAPSNEAMALLRPSPGHLALLDDLPLPGITPLRGFLARYAIEGSSPRALGELLAARFSSLDQINIQEVRALDPSGTLSRLMKDVAGQKIAAATAPRELIAVVSDLKNERLAVEPTPLLKLAGTLSPADFSGLLEATQPSEVGEFGDLLFRELVQGASSETLIGLPTKIDRLKLVSLRKDLISSRSFWPQADAECAKLLGSIADLFGGELAIAFPPYVAIRGPLTAREALQRFGGADLGVAGAMFEADNEAVRRTAADWLYEEADRFLTFAAEKRSVSSSVAQVLAEVAIARREPISPSFVSAWSMVASKTDVSSGGPALFAVGFLCALKAANDSLALGARFYDPLVEAVERGKATQREDEFLRTWLGNYGRLSRLISSAAVRRWPVLSNGPGVLNISNDPDHLDDLLREVGYYQGTSPISAAIRNAQLPKMALARARHYLKRYFSRKFWTPWW